MDVRISKDVIKVCKKNDELIRVIIVYDIEILNVISAYAPQVGIEK